MSDETYRGSDTELRAEFLASRFAEDYRRYQYAFVEFLVDHLTGVSKAFDGDLQQVLVLAVIGQVRLRGHRTAGEAGGVPPPAETLSITASRLADVTGIPRETVRRKLKLLEDRGWIARRPDGAWYLRVDAGDGEAPARRHLAEQDDRARRLVARLVADLENLADPSRP